MIRTGKCLRGHDLAVHGYKARNGRNSCRECKRLRALGQLVTLERHVQAQAIDLARLLGWRVAHFRPAQTSKGWRTPVAADGAGFPDLVLVRDRVIFLELKTERGKLSPAQKDWLRDLLAAGAEAYVVRPSDLDDLAAVLRAKGLGSGAPHSPHTWSSRTRLRERTMAETA